MVLADGTLVAQAETEALQGADSIIELSLPAVANYWLTAVRAPDGTVVLDGYLPSEAVRSRLAADPAVDPVSIELAGGEPDGFEAAVAFGIEQLSRMSEGRFSLRSTVLSLSGTAATQEDFETLAKPDTPEGFVLARNEILPAPEAPAQSDAPAETAAPPAVAPAQPSPVSADAGAAPSQLPVADPYVWSAGKDADGVVTLSGHIPVEPLRRILMLRAGEGAVDTTRFAAGAPEGFILDTRAAMDVLARLSQGEVAFDGTGWTVSGTLAEGTDDAALETALAEAATPAAQWSLTLTQVEPAFPPAAEPTAAPADTPASVSAAPAMVDACRTDLAGFSAANPILFRSGSAAIAEASQPALADLAGTISACPDVPVYVEGHTDADGAADANLALSVARAEAVITGLVGLGVAPARLYAVGYGESAPIAPNDTAQGKQLNRRIVVSLDAPED